MRGLMVALLAAACAASPPADARRTVPGAGTVEVAFSPWDNVESRIVAAIDAAREQVLVQAFSFTSRPIAQALVHAKQRGVDVQLTADREQTFSGEHTRIPEIAAAGIPVWLEARYQSAHNKVMIIDGETREPAVITGSYNWTAAAQRKNAENVLILRGNRPLAQAYLENWRRHRADALPYGEGRAP